ncbi:hypothetical protein ACFFGH_11545 [Lysobacter korlensis]|uniref:Lipoprotein n=1 Tax=Lysobacter korlensis TaxID=553636 RepID=A0ABV6RNA9_9GAMM
MRSKRMCGVGLGVALVLSAAGCAAPEPGPPQNLSAPVARPPADGLTMLGDADPAAGAVDASAALFEASPVVVLAGSGFELSAASVAVALGVPALPADADPDVLSTELDRLGADHVVLLGEGPAETVLEGRTALHVEPTGPALEAALGVRFTERTVAADASAAEAVSGLDPASPELLVAESGSPASPTDAPVSEPLPELEPAERASGLVALAVDDSAGIAGLATARAAGAEVLILPADRPNPQASPEAIEFLAQHADARVVALGPELGAEPSLDWKIASARSGLQLPGGGQLLFPAHMMVAIYGTPGAPVLGVLGEQDLPASIERARRHAAAFDELTDKTVLPAFELIATVASSSAGSDKNYSNELDPAGMLEWAEAAGEAGMYAILDLQPGHTDFVSQAKLYEESLRLPWVGLALDPEWRLGPGEKHMVHIGSVGSAEVNAVQDYLTELVRAHDLPPKLLVLHQFRNDMIEDRAGIETDRPEVTVLIHADGQGSQPEKQATWQRLRTDAPDVAWGWKNFYDEDAPMLDPEQTMMVEPVPDLITYQ